MDLRDPWAPWDQVDLVGQAITCQGQEVPQVPHLLEGDQATVDHLQTIVAHQTISTHPLSTDWDLAGHALCQIHPRIVDLQAESVVSRLAGRVRQDHRLFLLQGLLFHLEGPRRG